MEDVAGKVILITGASSGIGEHMAYAYAKRGACLALAARREQLLLEVANKAKKMGSPKVLVITADVSKVDDCKRMIDATIDHFGQVDHLVNNAGVVSSSRFESYSDVSDVKPVMEINFWGAVYTTKFAIPHLRKSKGRIIVISSGYHWIPNPTTSVYNASKAAMTSFFETLRIELAPDINVTIVILGMVDSEMTRGRHLLKDDEMFINQTMRDICSTKIWYLFGNANGFAEAIVRGICRGRGYLHEPVWEQQGRYVYLLCPEVVYWVLKKMLPFFLGGHASKD
ncbi:hypothetical protein Droror1_Dr00021462 [Drosera rotundifolia]